MENPLLILFVSQSGVEAEIGRGGFGMVYHAIDTSLNRHVAIKILNPLMMHSPSEVMRFQREARTMARLDHPHIVPVYEIGDQAGRKFIAMKLIEGSNLADVIKQNGALGWEDVASVFLQIASAMEYAHQNGVIHRDLKPANVLLDSGRVMLTDFGLAGSSEQHSASLLSHRSSSANNVLGTASYIAPEIWKNERMSRASDIYALGCMLFEMVTGQQAFASDSIYGIMGAHDKGISLPETWGDKIPSGITDVLAKALAKDPNKRYESVEHFSEAVTTLAQNGKMQFESALEAKQAGELTIAIDKFSEAIELEPNNADYYAERGRTYFEAEQKQVRSDDYRQAIQDFTKAIALNPDDATHYQWRAKCAFYNSESNQEREGYTNAVNDLTAALELNSSLAECYELRGRCFFALENAGVLQNGSAKAIIELTRAIELSPATADYYYFRGTCYEQEGHRQKAIDDFSTVLELESNAPKRHRALMNRAKSYFANTHITGTGIRKAIEDASTAITQLPFMLDAYLFRAGVYYEAAERGVIKDGYRLAIPDFSRAIAGLPTDATYFFMRGMSYLKGMHAGQVDDGFVLAAEDFSEAIRLNSNCVEFYEWRGRCYLAGRQAGHFMEHDWSAIVDFTKAIALEPLNLSYLKFRGKSYMWSGQLQHGIQDFTTVLTINPSEYDAYELRATAYHLLAQSELGEQESLYNKALRDLDSAIRLNPSNSFYFSLEGRIYFEQQQFEKAIKSLKEAAKIAPNDPQILFNLAIYYEHVDEESMWLAYEKAAALGHEEALEKLRHHKDEGNTNDTDWFDEFDFNDGGIQRNVQSEQDSADSTVQKESQPRFLLAKTVVWIALNIFLFDQAMYFGHQWAGGLTSNEPTTLLRTVGAGVGSFIIGLAAGLLALGISFVGLVFTEGFSNTEKDSERYMGIFMFLMLFLLSLPFTSLLVGIGRMAPIGSFIIKYWNLVVASFT